MGGVIYKAQSCVFVCDIFLSRLCAMSEVYVRTCYGLSYDFSCRMGGVIYKAQSCVCV